MNPPGLGRKFFPCKPIDEFVARVATTLAVPDVQRIGVSPRLRSSTVHEGFVRDAQGFCQPLVIDVEPRRNCFFQASHDGFQASAFARFFRQVVQD